MESEEIFDYEKLLDTYYHEKETLREVINIFISTVERQISDMNELIDNPESNISEIRFNAHSIKGSSYNLTCTKLGNISFEIQKICDNGDYGKLKDAFGKLKAIYEETVEIIRKIT